jgi:DNA replication licensing factor MCM2
MFIDENEVQPPLYMDRIQQMCEMNGMSLEIDFQHLFDREQVLAMWLAEAPGSMLKIMDEVATQLVKEQFEQYGRIREEIHVRVAHCPSHETLRDLR